MSVTRCTDWKSIHDRNKVGRVIGKLGIPLYLYRRHPLNCQFKCMVYLLPIMTS